MLLDDPDFDPTGEIHPDLELDAKQVEELHRLGHSLVAIRVPADDGERVPFVMEDLDTDQGGRHPGGPDYAICGPFQVVLGGDDYPAAVEWLAEQDAQVHAHVLRLLLAGEGRLDFRGYAEARDRLPTRGHLKYLRARIMDEVTAASPQASRFGVKQLINNAVATLDDLLPPN